MILKCIATGSKGNCYAMSNNSRSEVLMIDLGVSKQEIMKGLNFKIANIVGAIISHEHIDHCRAVDAFEKIGINVFKPYEKPEELMKTHKFGGFTVTPFPLPHDETTSYGFLIRCDGESTLYLTDFEYCPYRFIKQKVNNILIECNYQKEKVRTDIPYYEHKVKGHCSLDTCVRFVRTNANHNLGNVILMHMGGDADESFCRKSVMDVVGNMTFVNVAHAGDVYLNIDDIAKYE